MGVIDAAQAGRERGAAASSVLLTLAFRTVLVFSVVSRPTRRWRLTCFCFHQPIEADMVSDFAWGTANAQPVTLSFWATSTLTGTFSGAIRNVRWHALLSIHLFNPCRQHLDEDRRHHPRRHGGNVGDERQRRRVDRRFDLGCGATYRGAAGAWASGNYFGATARSIVVATNGAVQLTGVKLEIGTVATPFNRQSLAKSMADCQRYYQSGGSLLQLVA